MEYYSVLTLMGNTLSTTDKSGADFCPMNLCFPVKSLIDFYIKIMNDSKTGLCCNQRSVLSSLPHQIFKCQSINITNCPLEIGLPLEAGSAGCVSY